MTRRRPRRSGEQRGRPSRRRRLSSSNASADVVGDAAVTARRAERRRACPHGTTGSPSVRNRYDRSAGRVAELLLRGALHADAPLKALDLRDAAVRDDVGPAPGRPSVGVFFPVVAAGTWTCSRFRRAPSGSDVRPMRAGLVSWASMDERGPRPPTAATPIVGRECPSSVVHDR